MLQLAVSTALRGRSEEETLDGATDWVLSVGSRFLRERGQERGCEALFLWSLLLAKERGKSWNRLLRGRRKSKGSRVPCVAEREGSVEKVGQLLFGEAKKYSNRLGAPIWPIAGDQYL